MSAAVLTSQEYRERYSDYVLQELLSAAETTYKDREDIQREVPKIREALGL